MIFAMYLLLCILDTDEVLSRGKVYIASALVTVRRPSPPTQTEEQTLDRQPDVNPNMTSAGNNNASDPPNVVVEITGIPGGTHKQMLSLFLENKKMSGGGVLRSLEYKGGVVALARFEINKGRLSFLVAFKPDMFAPATVWRHLYCIAVGTTVPHIIDMSQHPILLF